jgi:purine-nucleoside phosphorylase
VDDGLDRRNVLLMRQEDVEKTASALTSKLSVKPRVGIVLGSGLAGLADLLEDPCVIPTSDLPDYPPSTVAGHEGVFLNGRIGDVPVLLLKGRIHAYEGYSLAQVVLPIRLMALAGIETLILTNAAGGLNAAFDPGDIMLIEDHLNLHHASPLYGENVDDWGPRFPDMTAVYNVALRKSALELANSTGFTLRQGVYASCPGPQYETPAEINMLRTLGADAVGMSTVPEAIVARHMGLRVLGFSLISNLAAGISPTPLNHEEVVQAGIDAGPKLVSYLNQLLPQI